MSADMLRRWFTGAFVLLACAGAALQAQQPDSATVSGTVTNSVTGEPILRAHVALRGPAGRNGQNFAVLSDADGKFTMTPVPPGTYTLVGERIGFLSFGIGGVTVAAGDLKTDFKLKLTPTGAVSGRVLDSQGEPVQGAIVRVESSAGSQTANTDEQGRYRVFGLRPGKYRVQAKPERQGFGVEVRTDGSKDVHHAATYYSDALTRAGARLVDVTPAGELAGIDIRLAVTPVISISGRVSGLGAKQRATVEVTSAGDREDGPPAVVRADGTFLVSPVDPGKYYVVAWSGSGVNPLRSAPLEVEVAGTDIEHLELELIPAFDIAGKVVFDDPASRTPPQNAGRPTAGQGPSRVPLTRQLMLQGLPGITGTNLTAPLEDDDSFSLKKVSPGRFHVIFPWGFVRAVRVGDTETEGSILNLRGGASGPVTIYVGTLMAQISGTVTDSNGPAADARVILMSDRSEAPNIRVANTKPDGTYTFGDVPPGKYQIACVERDFYPNPTLDSALDDYAEVAQAVELRSGDKITKDLRRK